MPLPAAENLTHSAFVADQTIAFLAQQQPDRPFLCISGFYSPHPPWVVPRRFLELYDPSKLPLPRYGDGSVRPAEGPGSDAQLRSARHGYYAMVSEIDHYVGQILDQLAARGLSATQSSFLRQITANGWAIMRASAKAIPETTP